MNPPFTTTEIDEELPERFTLSGGFRMVDTEAPDTSDAVIRAESWRTRDPSG